MPGRGVRNTAPRKRTSMASASASASAALAPATEAVTCACASAVAMATEAVPTPGLLWAPASSRGVSPRGRKLRGQRMVVHRVSRVRRSKCRRKSCERKVMSSPSIMRTCHSNVDRSSSSNCMRAVRCSLAAWRATSSASSSSSPAPPTAATRAAARPRQPSGAGTSARQMGHVHCSWSHNKMHSSCQWLWPHSSVRLLSAAATEAWQMTQRTSAPSPAKPGGASTSAASVRGRKSNCRNSVGELSMVTQRTG
mmetsp:Transcript_133757/g.286040  ORF Transcript_133757/g.286040 Transcript_133757/m.286040 type:complete len:253 (+) Transcript_133757:378-1136(+)